MQKEAKAALEHAISYKEYRDMIDELLEQGKTTGPNQGADYIHYTNLNVTRMRRLDKTVTILDDIKTNLEQLTKDQTWLILTEAWCGDAAQVLPVIESMASLSDKIETRYVLRDEHPELMKMYLTDGGNSIPKILLIDKSRNEVYADWGPRPEELQKIIIDNKHSNEPRPYSEMAVEVQRWYAKDKTIRTQREFASVIN